jgi:RNA polymerase sigma factor (sigma-70 family)
MQADLDFSLLVDKYIDMVYRIAFNCLKNQADSDDITQSVMMKLCRATREFESETHIKNWLIRVTVNECKKAAVSVWRRRVKPIEDYANSLSFQTPERSDLFYAVMGLPSRYRIVIYLYYYERGK